MEFKETFPGKPDESDPDTNGFELTEKAQKAALVDLSARLSKREAPPKTAGLDEIKRLFKLAKKETWPMSGKFAIVL